MTGQGAAPWDVAVVGAGPAGCSAAYHLARRGRRVLLLDRSRFPRDKACGDGLTVSSVALLSEMGLGEALGSHQKVRGIRVRTKNQGERDFLYRATARNTGTLGIVVPRYELDHLLSRRALEAGAVLWERSSVVDLLRNGGPVTGVRVTRDLSVVDVPARYVVMADGGASRLGARAGLCPLDHWSIGFAIRGYYRLRHEAPDLFEVDVPLSSPLGGGVAGYGWVFPVTRRLANVGVGFFPTQSTDLSLNPRDLLARFLDDLGQRDERFSGITLEGRLRGGRLPSGVDSDACQGRGVLLAGDAAGLVDPFTGEGIGGALESGKLAAEVLDRALSKPNGSQADLSEYGQRLHERFGEQFRIGRRLVKTYSFMWKVLEETFHVDSALFDSLRRAAIVFGAGPPELGTLPRRAWDLLERLELMSDFEAVARRFRLVLRSENPIFSKVARGILDEYGSFVRLALLHLCRRLGPAQDGATAVVASTAIELAVLALDIQQDVLDEDEGDRKTGVSVLGVSWANRFALTAGNWALVESYKLLAELPGEVMRTVARTCAELSCAMLERIQRARRGSSARECLDHAARTTGAIFELCCNLGSILTRVPPADRPPLARFGRRLGVAYQLAREAQDVLLPVADLRSHPLAHALRRRSLPFPVAWTLEQRPGDGLAEQFEDPAGGEESIAKSLRILCANGSITATYHEALAERDQAIRALDFLPEDPQRTALLDLAGEAVPRLLSS